MLWWLIGLWLASPAFVPILWLLGRVHQSLTGNPEAASLTPGD
jgi:hypothetical protein